MKKALFILFLVTFAALAQGETRGYLSFEYAKGQEKSEFALGTFQNALMGFLHSGDITPRLSFVSEARFRQESRLEVEQAYLDVKASESFSIKLGLYLVPFGQYNLSNRPHQTMLIKAPLHVESLFPSSWRDIGVLVEGRWSGIFYSAYLGNGLIEGNYLNNGQQFADNNKDKGKGVRAGVSLSRSLEVAFSYYSGKYDQGNERDLILKGVDLSWITEGFQILSEYARADLENPSPFSKGKTEGYFVQVSFDISGLRPVGSYQKLTYHDPYHGEGFTDSGGLGIDEEKSRWTIGLIYFASPNVLFKVEYELNRETEGEIKNNVLFIQMALHF